MGNENRPKISEDFFLKSIEPTLHELVTASYVGDHHKEPTKEEYTHLHQEMTKELEEVLNSRKESFNLAIQILFKKLPQSLSKEDLQQVISELKKTPSSVSKEEFQNKINEDTLNYQQFFGYSDFTMDHVFNQGVASFQEEYFEEARSIFDFLTFLNPLMNKYWISLGLSLKKLGKFEEALTAFAMTYLFNPQPLLARGESVECYIALHELNDAQIELEELEKLVKTDSSLSKDWNPIIEELKRQLLAIVI